MGAIGLGVGCSGGEGEKRGDATGFDGCGCGPSPSGKRLGNSAGGVSCRRGSSALKGTPCCGSCEGICGSGAEGIGDA